MLLSLKALLHRSRRAECSQKELSLRRWQNAYRMS